MRFAVLALSAALAGCSTSTATIPKRALATCHGDNSSVSKYVKGSPVSPPKLVRRIETSGAGTINHYPAVATVEAVIGADGHPSAICLVSGDPVWGHAVASALQQWRFEPAKLDGVPVPVSMDFTMSHMPTTMSTMGWSGPCGSWGTGPADPCSGGRIYGGGTGGIPPQ